MLEQSICDKPLASASTIDGDGVVDKDVDGGFKFRLEAPPVDAAFLSMLNVVDVLHASVLHGIEGVARCRRDEKLRRMMHQLGWRTVYLSPALFASPSAADSMGRLVHNLQCAVQFESYRADQVLQDVRRLRQALKTVKRERRDVLEQLVELRELVAAYQARFVDHRVSSRRRPRPAQLYGDEAGMENAHLWELVNRMESDGVDATVAKGLQHRQRRRGHRQEANEAAENMESNPVGDTVCCPHCDKQYASALSLQSHLRKRHSHGEVASRVVAAAARVSSRAFAAAAPPTRRGWGALALHDEVAVEAQRLHAAEVVSMRMELDLLRHTMADLTDMVKATPYGVYYATRPYDVATAVAEGLRGASGAPPGDANVFRSLLVRSRERADPMDISSPPLAATAAVKNGGAAMEVDAAGGGALTSDVHQIQQRMEAVEALLERLAEVRVPRIDTGSDEDPLGGPASGPASGSRPHHHRRGAPAGTQHARGRNAVTQLGLSRDGALQSDGSRPSSPSSGHTPLFSAPRTALGTPTRVGSLPPRAGVVDRSGSGAVHASVKRRDPAQRSGSAEWDPVEGEKDSARSATPSLELLRTSGEMRRDAMQVSASQLLTAGALFTKSLANFQRAGGDEDEDEEVPEESESPYVSQVARSKPSCSRLLASLESTGNPPTCRASSPRSGSRNSAASHRNRSGAERGSGAAGLGLGTFAAHETTNSKGAGAGGSVSGRLSLSDIPSNSTATEAVAAILSGSAAAVPESNPRSRQDLNSYEVTDRDEVNISGSVLESRRDSQPAERPRAALPWAPLDSRVDSGSMSSKTLRSLSALSEERSVLAMGTSVPVRGASTTKSRAEPLRGVSWVVSPSLLERAEQDTLPPGSSAPSPLSSVPVGDQDSPMTARPPSCASPVKHLTDSTLSLLPSTLTGVAARDVTGSRKSTSYLGYYSYADHTGAASSSSECPTSSSRAPRSSARDSTGHRVVKVAAPSPTTSATSPSTATLGGSQPSDRPSSRRGRSPPLPRQQATAVKPAAVAPKPHVAQSMVVSRMFSQEMHSSSPSPGSRSVSSRSAPPNAQPGKENPGTVKSSTRASRREPRPLPSEKGPASPTRSKSKSKSSKRTAAGAKRRTGSSSAKAKPGKLISGLINVFRPSPASK